MDGNSPLTLDTKYSASSGRIYVTGTQALVRLPMMQRARDLANSMNTAGYITGYRGSPVGGYDSALWDASDYLEQHHIRFQAGVNEDMAATACWGTQQVGIWKSATEQANYDGVFAIWYGKGPGVDRSGDALKHGNLAGASPNGGVLVLAGDDQGAKSSTTAHQSEQALIAAMIPILYPASVQEYIDYGLMGFAMSRFSGCWTGFKCVGDIIESTASISIDPDRLDIKIPHDFEFPEDGIHIRWPDGPVEQEKRLISVKLKAAQAFVRENKLDRVTHRTVRKRLGIVAPGKAWLNVCQAFEELGLSDAERQDLGLGVFKVAMPWPLEPTRILSWAESFDEVLVIEEKRNLIEDQLARILYDMPVEIRPRLVGKRDGQGNLLVPEFGELNGTIIAQIIANRFLEDDQENSGGNCLVSAAAAIKARTSQSNKPVAPPERSPWFCAGCPHNSSTKVPEGSRALAGIGCHTMSVYMDRRTAAYTHMGGEGGTWIGQAPFTTAKHVFQNIGDGTYYHSGLMAIRAAVSSGVNITYKILFNDAVALTGGQPMDGELYPWTISEQIAAEGVGRIAVISDEPEKYADHLNWAPQVEIFHRRELERIQLEMRELEGVTAIIYDQTCAAEKRRRRKRGLYPDPARRVFINDAVCEGCGDCNTASNCVAVRPLDTPIGRKRVIDQSSCNKDFSCLEGFCPSLATVEGGYLRKSEPPNQGQNNPAADLPDPELPEINGTYHILLTGIGGTGVITVGANLGMAAHLEGKSCSVLDQTGLSQKNGAVMSHVSITNDTQAVLGTRISTGMSDLVIGFDMVVAAGKEALNTMSIDRTRAIINDHLVPLAAFAERPDMPLEAGGYTNVIETALGAGKVDFFDATQQAAKLLGDSIASNIFQLGYAYQKGSIPLKAASIEQAIRLNNVAVEMNLRAFAWGRVAAAEPERLAGLIGAHETEAELAFNLDRFIEDRAGDLTAYQNKAYAKRYQSRLEAISATENKCYPGNIKLTEAVARALYKVMAYKDEYEVARAYTDPSYQEKIKAQFDGDYKLKLHFAPPLFAAKDKVTGQPFKKEYGSFMWQALKVLAPLKVLRGTPLDPFGYLAERKEERKLIRDYENLLNEISGTLSSENYDLAVELASLPMQIRGFGHVKARAIKEVKAEEESLLALYRTSSLASSKAAE
ncbi:MAG: indolepyruvate ferredoxin oxidoreductase family protein [Rhodospirillaceae bacterium]|nr:indolepyruvate ferredoxin oxidoreductase family protein [Rhodospirillaceae bacterium]MBT7267329.1 indolepyruvate ferredoxin oxidoreductase family protein [Rhodospirillaceae bacterium]